MYVKLLAYVVVLVLLRKVEGERKVEVAEKIMCTLRLADGENGIEGVDDLSQEHLTLEVCLLLFFLTFCSLTRCFLIGRRKTTYCS